MTDKATTPIERYRKASKRTLALCHALTAFLKTAPKTPESWHTISTMAQMVRDERRRVNTYAGAVGFFKRYHCGGFKVGTAPYHLLKEVDKWMNDYDDKVNSELPY